MLGSSRVFRAVVANGSVHGAATQLGYTPSTISQHITALQRETRSPSSRSPGGGSRPLPPERCSRPRATR
ncbi:MAG TPA: LysR family transcriptional regulator [Propionibacteriaceae bacterium]|nr:LysR family transcriptional regulator [Propionibacteriaceae bacterium]